MPPKKVSEEEMKCMLDGLESRFEEKFLDIEKNIQSVKDTVIKRLVDENKKLRNRLYTLECEVYKSQQYNRRNNIEVNGIPDNVDDSCLEGKIIKVLDKLGVKDK